MDRRTARSRLAHLFAAEASKLATLPAVRWTLLATGALSILFTVLFSVVYKRTTPASSLSLLDVTVEPIPYVQAGFLILGVLAITSEHAGTIRTTLTTTPQRVRVYLTKAGALTLYTLPAAVVISAISVVIGRTILGDTAGVPATGAVLERLATVSVYLVLVALIAYAVATVLRRELAAVALVLGYFFIAGPLLRQHATLNWLPDSAGLVLWNSAASPPDLAASTAWLALLAWTLGLLTITTTVFRSRDV